MSIEQNQKGCVPNRETLASLIDHTLLKPDAVEADIVKLCDEAKQHCFASACVNPVWVSVAVNALKGSPVKVCTVAGFPLGAQMTPTKIAEAYQAMANGASELDMVIHVGALREGKRNEVLNDIRKVREVTKGRILKVILEAALLTDEQKELGCKLVMEAGADFVKTSTGFGPSGATVHDVALFRRVVGKSFGVKASAGIRDYETAVKIIEAGASRIGTSSGVAIVAEKK